MTEPHPYLSFDRGTLLLKGLNANQTRTFFESNPWTWDSRVSAWRCDAIEYETIRKQVQDHVEYVEDSVPDWQKIVWQKVDIHPLRPEQQAALDNWMNVGRGVIVMPTGTGKTEVALSIMQRTAISTLVVAPVRDLMYQWHRRILSSLGYDAGVIGDNIFNVRPVSVTTYDSACIHMDQLGSQFGLIIFDECHHLPGNLRKDAARMSAAPLRLGLTATPERSDGRHIELDRLIGLQVYNMPISAARGKTLADYEIVRIPVHLSDEEQRRYNELSDQIRRYMFERRRDDHKFTWDDLCAETGKEPEARRAQKAFYAKKAIEDRAAEKLRALEDILRLRVGSRTIIFAGSNAMARDVSRRFLVPCLLNHCGKNERREILDGLQDGTYPAIVANQVLDEGVDIPEAKVAVVIGGMSSTRQAKQRLGRILRKIGNMRAVLYEVVCEDTNEEKRSRRRRASDAYKGTRHRKTVKR